MKEIVEKLNKIKDRIVSEKGAVPRLFVLIERNDLDAKWDILFSTDWLEKTNSEKDLIYVIDQLKTEFNGNLDFLARILMAKPDDLFIKSIAKAIIKSDVNTPGEVNELFVKEGLVIHRMFVVSLDFNGMDLESGTEESGPIAVREGTDF
jgi:hypothetical protein